MPIDFLNEKTTMSIIDKTLQKEGKVASLGHLEGSKKFDGSHFINCDLRYYFLFTIFLGTKCLTPFSNRYYNLASLGGKFDAVLIDPPW